MTPAAARESAGLSQSEAARRIGCARYTLIRWERGMQTPSATRLAQLAKVYGVPVEVLARHWSDDE